MGSWHASLLIAICVLAGLCPPAYCSAAESGIPPGAHSLRMHETRSPPPLLRALPYLPRTTLAQAFSGVSRGAHSLRMDETRSRPPLLRMLSYLPRTTLAQAFTSSGWSSARTTNPEPSLAPTQSGPRLPTPAIDSIAETGQPPPPDKKTKLPASLGELFGTATRGPSVARFWSGKITGFYRNSFAYTYASPTHLSEFRNTLDLATEGRWGDRVRWHAEVRGSYDAAYDLTDFFPEQVGDAERFDASVRDTYADLSAGDWNFRLGRQQIVWGEAVGLFFADVVTAKDLRQFVLPPLSRIRIPQWATRAEYFRGNFHAEFVWIPFTTVDEIGVPGSDFYPDPRLAPPGFAEVFNNEIKPSDSPANSGVGLRASYLYRGWDTALFYYTSIDEQAAFERRVIILPTPSFVYTPIHRRIHQFGATTARSFGPFVFRAESVYTLNRLFSVTRLSDPNGLVHQDVLDYVLGLEYFGPHDLDLDVQFFQRWFPHHDPYIVPDALESGYTLRLSSSNIYARVKPQVLFISSLNRSDWLLQAQLAWEFQQNWRLTGGVDVFHGQADGLFGQFDNKSRIFTELRYSF